VKINEQQSGNITCLASICGYERAASARYMTVTGDAPAPAPAPAPANKLPISPAGSANVFQGIPWILVSCASLELA